GRDCGVGGDVAEAGDGEGVAADLDACIAGALPLATLNGGVRLRDVARQREEQADRVLGSGDDVAARSVHDEDSPAGRRGHVDVVDADAGPTHDLQAGGGVQDGGGHLCLAA